MNRCTGRERKNPVWPPEYQWIWGLPQCFQSRVTCSRGCTNLIGDAGVDEAALHRHAGSQCKWGDHPADGLGQPHRLTEGIVTAQAGVAVDQLDQVDGGDAQNRTGKTVVEAGDQRREETAEGDAVQPDHRIGLL